MPKKIKSSFFAELDSENCSKAAACILCGFVWAKSVEGHDYWMNVYSKLIGYSKLKKINRTQKRRS